MKYVVALLVSSICIVNVSSLYAEAEFDPASAPESEAAAEKLEDTMKAKEKDAQERIADLQDEPDSPERDAELKAAQDALIHDQFNAATAQHVIDYLDALATGDKDAITTARDALDKQEKAIAQDQLAAQQGFKPEIPKRSDIPLTADQLRAQAIQDDANHEVTDIQDNGDAQREIKRMKLDTSDNAKEAVDIEQLEGDLNNAIMTNFVNQWISDLDDGLRDRQQDFDPTNRKTLKKQLEGFMLFKVQLDDMVSDAHDGNIVTDPKEIQTIKYEMHRAIFGEKEPVTSDTMQVVNDLFEKHFAKPSQEVLDEYMRMLRDQIAVSDEALSPVIKRDPTLVLEAYDTVLSTIIEMKGSSQDQVDYMLDKQLGKRIGLGKTVELEMRWRDQVKDPSKTSKEQKAAQVQADTIAATLKKEVFDPLMIGAKKDGLVFRMLDNQLERQSKEVGSYIIAKDSLMTDIMRKRLNEYRASGDLISDLPLKNSINDQLYEHIFGKKPDPRSPDYTARKAYVDSVYDRYFKDEKSPQFKKMRTEVDALLKKIKKSGLVQS